MADLIFLNGGFPAQVTVGNQTSVFSDSSGNINAVNEAYFMYATFPALNLPPVVSNKPVLNRAYGWVNGG